MASLLLLALMIGLISEVSAQQAPQGPAITLDRPLHFTIAAR